MDRRTGAPLVAEAIGTFLFFFVGAGAVVLNDHLALAGGEGAGLLGVALAHGLALAVLVSAFGSVSGGHFNPAVTLGVWISGAIGSGRAPRSTSPPSCSVGWPPASPCVPSSPNSRGNPHRSGRPRSVPAWRRGLGSRSRQSSP